MKPSSAKTNLPPSTRLRGAVFEGSILKSTPVCIRAGIVLCLAAAAPADTPVTVLTDTQLISGFELSHDTVSGGGGPTAPATIVVKGIYWWDGPGQCSGSFPTAGTIRLRATVPGATRTLASSCHLLQGNVFNVVRDDDYAYFFQDAQLKRKALGAPEGVAPLTLPTPPFSPTLQHYDDSPLELKDGLLYWSDYEAGPDRATVYRMPGDASSAPEVLFAITGAGPVRKLKFFQYDVFVGGPIDALAVLFTDGKLYRRDLTTPATLLLSTGVTDFAIHNVITTTATATSIYAARGTSAPAFLSTVPGSEVLKINPDSGASFSIYTVDAATKNQVVSITTDSDKVVPDTGTAPTRNIYLSENVASCAGASCTVVDTKIKRRTLPAGPGDWGTIVESGGGDNLRSDDRWLYMRSRDGFSIQRISTGAPVIELDIMADALEVTQETQDLNHSVPLISGKPTFVRGYAHLTANTSSQPAYKSDATLSVFRGATLLGTRAPLNSPGFDTTSNLDALRRFTANAFLFQLEPAWTTGTIRLVMHVNASGAIPESSNTPGDLTANNSVALSSVSFGPGADPCFMFVPVRSTGGPYYSVGAPGSGTSEILNRARSLLPNGQLAGWKVDSDPIEKPVLVFKVKLCLCKELLTVIEYRPFDMSTEDSTAIAWLQWRRFKNRFSPGFRCDDFHYVGTIHPGDTSSFNGLGDRPGDCLIARMQTGPNNSGCGAALDSSPWELPFGGQALAHELGHNYGRMHIDQTTSPSFCCGSLPGGELDGAFPGDPCWLGAAFNGPTALYGFDPISQTAIQPTNAGDIMTYGASTWISKYTFNAILSKAASPLAAAVKFNGPRGVNGSSMLLVQALVGPSANLFEFEPFYVFPNGVADPVLVAKSQADAAQLPPEWPYRLRLLDAAGSVLSETPCVLTEAEGTGPTTYSVAQFLAFPNATCRVELLQDGVVQAERLVSAHKPTLVVQPPMVDLINQTVTLNWAASDGDNDPLLFTVQYSADAGVNWEAKVADYPYLSKTFSTGTLAGSESALFRVFVTDGVNTTFAMTPPFALPRHAPRAMIEGVTEGQRVPFGQRRDLLGLAVDAEDGSLAGAGLSWSLSGPSPVLATGDSVALDELAPGSYTANLSGADQDNNPATATHSFEILSLPIPEAQAPPLLDGLCADAAYSHATFVRLPLGNGEFAQAFLTHFGSNLYVCFTGLQFGGQFPGVAGIRVDVDNSRDNSAAPGDIGFFVDSDGFPYQEAGTAQGMDVTYSPQKGFVAVIERGSDHWTAEFVIADNLLGGRNHAAGLMLMHDAAHWPPLSTDHSPATWSPAFFGANLPPQSNRPPVADAGPDQNINAGSDGTVFLNGSGSYDPDGGALIFNWVQLSGPPVTLKNATTATPGFDFSASSAPATFQFVLGVSDGTLSSSQVQTRVRLLSTPGQTLPDSVLEAQSIIVNDQFRLHFVGEPGRRFAILASTDLVTWTTEAVRTADFYGTIDYFDRAFSSRNRRYYQIIPSQ